MTSQDYWELFEATGAPELYLMYNNARKMENINVFNHTGSGDQGHSL